jgi:hypothetical protein
MKQTEGEGLKALPFPSRDAMIHSPPNSKAEPRHKRKKRMDKEKQNACNENKI